MSVKRENKKANGITRREFMKKSGMAGAAVGAMSVVPSLARRVFAAKRDHILIGHPNPSTGPLAGFGEASPWADELAIAAINKKGGNDGRTRRLRVQQPARRTDWSFGQENHIFSRIPFLFL